MESFSQENPIPEFSDHKAEENPKIVQKEFQQELKYYEKVLLEILKENSQNLDHQIGLKRFQDFSLWTINVKQISSTMLLSQRWPKERLNSRNAFVFRADSQSKGRGQRTNSWVSPEGNLYMTLLLSAKTDVLLKLPMYTAVITANTLNKETGINCKLKWINDIFINEEKVGGFLIKGHFFEQESYCQIGIGVNVKKSPIQGSTSIQQHSPKKIDLNNLSVQISKNMIFDIQQKWKESLLSISKEYQSHLLYLGKHVFIYDQKLQKIQHEGVFIGVDEFGRVILEGVEGIILDGRMRDKKLE